MYSVSPPLLIYLENYIGQLNTLCNELNSKLSLYFYYIVRIIKHY